jgi:hypothetical protein
MSAIRRSNPDQISIATSLLIALAVVFGLVLPSGRGDRSAELAGLPGLPGEAPLLTGPPSLSDMDAARARNAAVAFVRGPIAPAPRFGFTGSPEDRSRATECLALAAMAEAGPSDTGQRAVIQVILNRVRHPAFAKTVCGVVFEGSERQTGCQFTFTCDGSLARRYSDSAWDQARLRAAEGLGGYVFKPVGLATHYHTDWVYPYWSPELDKLAKIETHLFFRWPGFWGTRAAFSTAYRGGEPDPATLFGDAAAILSEAGPIPTAVPDAPKIDSGMVVMRNTGGKANFILLAGTAPADALAAARSVCNQPGTCRVLGWSDPAAIPQAFPIPPAARAALQFSYSRDPGEAEIVLYGCSHFVGVPREQCIPRAR